MMFHIYYLIDPRKDEPFYVGYTKNEKTRLSRHIKEVNQLKKHGKCESNNLLKVGTIRQIIESGSKPIFKVVESVDDFNEIKRLEICHIDKYGLRILNTGTLTNMTLGGEGSKGKPKSAEECARRVATRKARNGGNWHSVETKQAIAESRKGFKSGKPAWNRGLTKDNNEAMARASSALVGRIPWNKIRNKDEH